MTLLAFNIESNGLLREATEIWTIVVAKDEDTFITFRGEDLLDKFETWALAQESPLWVGHNVIAYDIPLLKRFGVDTDAIFNHKNVRDTLVISRMWWQAIPKGNSLDAWAKRIRFEKRTQVPFDKDTDDLAFYNKENTLACLLLYKWQLRNVKESDVPSKALMLEQEVAFLAARMQDRGMYFNVVGATRLHRDLTMRVGQLLKELQDVFPPVDKYVKTFTVKAKKDGSASMVGIPVARRSEDWEPGDTGDIFETVVFNPGSTKQVIDRLLAWGVNMKNWEKTDGHVKAIREARFGRGEPVSERMEMYGYKINEHNLALAPKRAWPLLEYIVLNSRVSTLDEWFNAYDRSTHCIHGEVNTLGTWTGRMSHSKPNVGNIAGGGSRKYATKELKDLVSSLGVTMRKLFTARPGRVFVGSDADGIQLRVLAHLLDDEDYTKEVVEGDIHTKHMEALGDVCADRNHAKTYIYAYLLGAGVGKVAEILDSKQVEAKSAMAMFQERIPGLKKLQEEGLGLVQRGGGQEFFIKGLDGRTVVVPSERKKLAAYLQQHESTIMKTVAVYTQRRIDEEKLDAFITNIVHDELCVDAHPDCADAVGEIMTEAYGHATETLHVKAPITGGYAIGPDWYEVH